MTTSYRPSRRASVLLTGLGIVALPLGGCLADAPAPSDGTSNGSSSGDRNLTGPGGDPACIDPGSCTTGTGGSGSGGGVPGGANCGAQTIPLGSTQVTPNVLLVIDRSGSMAEKADNNVARWDGLKSSLGVVLDDSAGKAYWGLMLFPSGTQNDSCQAGTVNVPIALGDEAAVKSAVNAYSTAQISALRGRTPTSATMQAVRSAGVLVDPARPNYVVLMTDGEPNCDNPQGVTPAIAALASQSPSVRTFVIGFGAGINGSSATNLNEWAAAGGTARTGAATKYYPADTVAELQTAFDTIVTGVASCTYQLMSPPSDPALIAPYFDGVAVGQSTTNGFSYDAGSQSITFLGSSCAQLKASTVKKVEFVYGCGAATVL